MLDGIDLADIHGQYKFNFVHSSIARDDSKTWLDGAFERDYRMNGPTLYRMMRTMMAGWRRYRNDADARVRARVAEDAKKLKSGWGAALWAMERYLRESNRDVSDKIRGLRRAIDRLVGPVLLWAARRDAERFPLGRPLEPRTFVERRNWA
jgi:hypothetical protein